MRGQIDAYLKAQGRWPLSFYFSSHIDEDVRVRCGFPPASLEVYVENADRLIADDDLNYTVLNMKVVDLHGAGLTPAHVGEFWLGHLPYYATCTAERVAYRNLVHSVPTPGDGDGACAPFTTATFRNPYREWIGAQIRADFFGYCSPALPGQAADLAWRDACISHVKNGIYGAMWVAAMAAAAFVLDDPEEVIRAGMAEIPAACRLTRELETVLSWRREGRTHAEAVDSLHARWDEKNGHHWCHAISDAQIVAMALLYGDKDFGRTLSFAVAPGFDTDCNGATAGSILGVLLGHRALPPEWTEPLHDTLETGVQRYPVVALSAMAVETLRISRKVFPA